MKHRRWGELGPKCDALGGRARVTTNLKPGSLFANLAPAKRYARQWSVDHSLSQWCLYAGLERV